MRTAHFLPYGWGLCPGVLCPRGSLSGKPPPPVDRQTPVKQECIPVGCVPPACCPYLPDLPACTALGGVSAWGGYLPGGCTCQGGVPAWVGYLLGGVPAQGVYLARGVPAQGVYLPGGYLPRGLYLPGGCTCMGGTCPGTLPPVNRMTDRCKNITWPQTSFAGGKNILLSYWEQCYCFRARTITLWCLKCYLLFLGVPHVFMNGYNAFSGALDPEHICKYFDAVVKKERINLPV